MDKLTKFTYGSVCSGIEAVSCAWHDFATPVWFSEIEPFPCAVLEHRFPTVPNLGDMTQLSDKIRRGEIPSPDVLVGGTPCQAFSVAGLRQSLDDARGNLTLELVKILEAIDYVRQQKGQQPCILVWENVPGVLSTTDNAFGCFLAGLAQESEPLQPTGRKWTNIGYVHSKRTIAWRVLDAQYFGIPQRRKRVFLVASAREESITEVLFELKSLCRNIKQGATKREDATAFAESNFGTYRATSIGGTLKTCGGSLGGGSEIFVVHGSQDPIVNTTTANCLGRNNGLENVVAIAGNIIGRSRGAGGNGIGAKENISYTLTSADKHAVAYTIHADPTPKVSKDVSGTLRSQGGGGIVPPSVCYADNTGETLRFVVRRLTPVECERLQGFPDDWTKVPYRNKLAELCPDSPRYKAIGNSMAVPVMRWIGIRLNLIINTSLNKDKKEILIGCCSAL